MLPLSLIPMSPLDKLAESFLGRLVMTMLTVVVATLVTPFLFLANSMLLPVVLRWTALAWLGLAAGVAARGLLSAFPAPLRVLSAWSILLGCLFLLNQLTSGYVGVHTSLNPNPAIDWIGLLQVIFSASVTGLALFARRKPRVRVAPARQPAQAQPLSLPKAPAPKKTKAVKLNTPTTDVNPTPPALPRPLPWQPRLKNLGESLRLWRRRAGQAASHSRQKAGDLWKRSQQALRLPVRPSGPQVRFPSPRLRAPVRPAAPTLVRLVGDEERRCPYCLELVEPNDPRGIKICPECHTYHHADCWAMTGACQVPHHHA
jgi:hypothetical protein